MTKTGWNIGVMPGLDGKVAVVTGANSGIGLETARGLALKGAEVVIASRSLDKAARAADDVKKGVPGAKLELLELDLADLASVRAFAEAFKAMFQSLDLLVNNAGVMVPPLGKTKDGFEMQFGTNHLGHFALTGLLLERMLATPAARVVTLSSMMHRFGSIDFENLNAENSYSRQGAYGQSKLANLLFTRGLQRRFEAAGANAIAVAAHPGWTSTNLQRHTGSAEFLNRFFAQGVEQGALPTLYAAVAPEVEGGDYIGPDGFLEMRGHPKKVGSSAAARDPEAAERLWHVSEELTGVAYEKLESRAPA